MKTQFENSGLEAYVGELERGLHGLSETRRTEELTEIRQHLNASVAAHQEMGMGETEATEVAVRQFGAARLVSGDLQKALWREKRREKTRMPDTVAAAAFVTVAGSLALVHILAPLTSLLNDPSDVRTTLAFYVFWSVSCLMPRYLLAFLVGRLAPRNGVRGTLLGGWAYLIYSTVCLLVWVATQPGFHLPNGWWDIGGAIISKAIYGVAVVAAPTLAAWLGRRSAVRSAAEWSRTKIF